MSYNEAYISSDASVSEDEEETLFNNDTSSTKQEYNTLIDARSLQRRVRDLDVEQSHGVFIMTKYEEIYPPTIYDFVNASANSITTTQILL